LSVELSTRGLVLTATGLSAGYDRRAIVSAVGVVRVLEGHVKVGDVETTNMASEEIAKIGIGYVPQVEDVFPPLSVKENLEIGGYLLARREIPDRIEAVLEFFPRLKGMMTRKAGKLSGGERKMLAMGRVLMLSPSVLVLDEPTANLAPIVATQLLEEYIRGFADHGSTVLLVEQRAKAALRISDWTYVLGGGRIVLSGAPKDLEQNPAFVESFLGGGAVAPPPSDD
jgi:branched-chain amino acid transport system ATP-binding protein